jgi:REP element-mobilizing transposase RayT
MARQWRIAYPGALYHILSRGNDRREIFRSNADREMFLDLIGEFSDRFQIDVFAYVLMDNHYHLLLRTREGNISKAMQWLGTTYTRKFNNRHGVGGHLFQGRYKSILVENDQYLLGLSCYIHRNPIRAGMVKRLGDYPWSSYLSYGYARKTPEWLKTDLILGVVAQSGEDPRQHYRTKVQEYSDESASVWEDVKHGLIFGSEAFVTDIRSRFLTDETNPELPQYNRVKKAVSPDEMLKRMAAALDFDLENAIIKKRIPPSDRDKRDLLLYALWKTGTLTNQEIGKYFGLTYSAVSHQVSGTEQRLKQDKKLADLFRVFRGSYLGGQTLIFD